MHQQSSYLQELLLKLAYVQGCLAWTDLKTFLTPLPGHVAAEAARLESVCQCRRRRKAEGLFQVLPPLATLLPKRAGEKTQPKNQFQIAACSCFLEIARCVSPEIFKAKALAGIMRQVTRHASEQHFGVVLCPKNSSNNPKVGKIMPFSRPKEQVICQ